MARPYTYFYNGQIKQHIAQFLRIFSGLQVQYGVDRDGSGTNDFKTVSVHYGDMDRIVANVLHKQNTFVATSLPLIAGYLVAIELAPEKKMSKFHQENVSFQKNDSTRTVSQRVMGVPYRGLMDVSIFTSNGEQMFQLLEQILLMFNPTLGIQVNDNVHDWSYITTAELLSIANEQNNPSGIDERYIQQTLSFSFDFWLNYPYKEYDKIIQQITSNVKDNTFNIDGITLGSTTIVP